MRHPWRAFSAVLVLDAALVAVVMVGIPSGYRLPAAGVLVALAVVGAIVFVRMCTREPEPERDVESFPAAIRAQVPPARPYVRLWQVCNPRSHKGGRDA